MACILLIDDDPQVRTIFRQILERAGYEVQEARDGRLGVQCYRATPVDLVITDILMPEQEGLKTIQELRQLCPTVKIIAISGGSRQMLMDFLPIAEMLGAQRALHKPVRRTTLLAAVQEVLGHKAVA
ncbi:MAG: response regulator [Candidatus Tectomicrobia bacterium]|uniref:Response regulator n=1 Tax=Tectimicrobiota bacterium TaxID=2528274 RepID=A0A937W355_UNCTE|nr:response regulator [Candidatus Tectomicrobia bacterium]